MNDSKSNSSGKGMKSDNIDKKAASHSSSKDNSGNMKSTTGKQPDVNSTKPSQYSRAANEGKVSVGDNNNAPSSLSSNDVAKDSDVKQFSDKGANIDDTTNSKSNAAPDKANGYMDSDGYHPPDMKDLPKNDVTGAPMGATGDMNPDYVKDTIDGRQQAAINENNNSNDYDKNNSNYEGHSDLNDEKGTSHGTDKYGNPDVKDTGAKDSEAPKSSKDNIDGSNGAKDATQADNATIGNNAAGEAAKESAKSQGGIINGIKNAGGKALEGSVNFLKNGIALFTRGITKAAIAIGTSVKAMTMVTILGGGTGVFLIAGMVLGIFNDNRIIYDDDEDCLIVNEQYEDNQNSGMGGLGNVDQMENAKLIYSALSDESIGYKDCAIAGMLSCATRETSLNPKVYEGWYINNSTLQSYAFKDWDAYTKKLHEVYHAEGMSINESAYIGDDGKKYPAFGYWQWTGPRTSKLMAFASEVDLESTGGGINDSDGDGFSDRVYDTDVQIAFLLKEDCAGVNDWGQNPKKIDGSSTNDPVACADWFCYNWEGGRSAKALAQHNETAQKWYDLITSQGWKSDSTYANSILAMAEVNLSGAGANGMEAAYASSGCPKPEADLSNFDNTSIAACAMSWSWPQNHSDYCDIHDSSTKCSCGTAWKMTLCTSQYVMAHNIVNKGADLHYSSCDRGVATAVHASGSDDGFPNGDVSTIRKHMNESEKWVLVGPCTKDNADKLQPGDILCGSQHVIVYVGGDLAKAKYGDLDEFKNAKYSVVHSSHSIKTPPASRGPRCDAEMYDWSGDFKIYRCVKPDGAKSEKKKLIDAADMSKYWDGSKPSPKSLCGSCGGKQCTDSSHWSGKLP